MHKYVLTSIALLPLLLSFSQAAQNWSVDPSAQPFVFSSDDSGGSSYLGVDIDDVTADRLSALKLKEEKGVEIKFVDPDAPAGKAGLKEHDVILTMNGTTVESAAQLRRMIHETPAGRIVTLGLSRDGEPLTLRVQLGDKEKEYGRMHSGSKGFYFEMPKMPAMPEIDIPSMTVVTISQARSGLTVENMSPQLGEFFGVRNGNGVLVRSVEKGSRAEKAGFRAGDVIVKINDQPVHDTGDFSRSVRSRNGNSVNVGVIRDKKEQTLTLALPEKGQSGGLMEEESLQDQGLDSESRVELGKLQDELAKLGPQMELATESYRKSAAELHRSLCDQKKQLRQQTEKQREQLRKQEQELRIQVEKMQREMRHNLIRVRTSMDI